MKSAYELAMERLQKTSPSLSLTEEQKKELAEIDSKYRAKIAEKELFLRDQIRKAQTEGKADDIDSLEKQLASDVRRLQEECEAAKEKLRAQLREIRVAHASRVLASASSRSRTSLLISSRVTGTSPTKSLFRRDAKTSTRDACATRTRSAQRVRQAQHIVRVSANRDRESRACERA